MATTNATPTFADAGTLFNETTHLLEGGLWQNVVSEGGQGLGSAGKVATDLQTVQADLQAGVAAGQYTGQALTDVQSILSSVGQEIAAATASVNGGGTFGSVAAAETALHNLHLGVINTVAADPTLAAAATAGGATGFQAAPAAFAAGVTAQNAPHANLADIGAIFNDAANMMIGGVNSSNAAAIKSDIDTARVDLQQLMAANPSEFGGLTGIHADTVVRQLKLEDTFLSQVGTNPDAARASNDNMNDINDIIQGDTNLANMASQGGVTGFTPLPALVTPTPHYQDNADQTNFWANFIAQSNSLGAAAEAAVAGGDKATITSLVSQLKAFETNSANFDQSQGGIFEARFDNELAKGTSTLGAEVAAMIKGLNSGNAALVTAAAEEMHANAADVGGNNIPVNGGTYNTDGLTARRRSRPGNGGCGDRRRPPQVPLLRRQPPPRTLPPTGMTTAAATTAATAAATGSDGSPGNSQRHGRKRQARPPQQRKRQPQQPPQPAAQPAQTAQQMLEQPPQRRRPQPQLRLLLPASPASGATAQTAAAAAALDTGVSSRPGRSTAPPRRSLWPHVGLI